MHNMKAFNQTFYHVTLGCNMLNFVNGCCYLTKKRLINCNQIEIINEF